jgi:predicted signal transduction protein with EAL and GGDEF domain
LGQLLALATVIALLFALGLPESGGDKSRFLVVAYSAVVLFALLGNVLGRAFDEARRLSVTDPLTGLYNRRHFGQRLSEEAKRAQRGLAISIGIAELDTTAGMEPADLLLAADRALYQAKAAGGGAGRLAIVAQERGSLLPWTALDHAPGFVSRIAAPRPAV